VPFLCLIARSRCEAIGSRRISTKRFSLMALAILQISRRVRSHQRRKGHLFASVRDFFKEASIDYDPSSRHCKSFYAVVQDKFHYAVSAMTAAEIVLDRANHRQPHMGLQTFRWKFADSA